MATALRQLACCLLLLAAACASGCRPGSEAAPSRSAEYLRGNSMDDSKSNNSPRDVWEKVTEPRRFAFPRDHGAHPEYQIEWWYYTGNLFSSTGRRFGYQLTFFRTGIQREPSNPSPWTVRDLYIAHFAISDCERGELTRFERSSRAGLDWAGADTEGQRVWNGDWQLTINADERHRLEARENDVAIDLVLTLGKPPALHGDQGLSRKGSRPGNASYYYSLTRLETTGQIQLGGETFDVEGASWMDHEFSSSFLERGQLGWDWFSIQLDDGTELMIYQIRRDDGSRDTASSGTFVDTEGACQTFGADDFTLTPGRTWTSPESGGRYPVMWQFAMPGRDVELTIEAVYPEQEMDTRISTGILYWEGCIDVTGRIAGREATGHGYLEMTGYVGDGLGGMLGQ